MTDSEYQAEHERLFRWRARWMRLSNKHEPGRLAVRQEAIERRAAIANNRIGALMKEHGRLDNLTVEQSSRTVIEHKLLAALDDPADGRVAILVSKDDLDFFILMFSATDSRKAHQWAKDMEQLRREAFGTGETT